MGYGASGGGLICIPAKDLGAALEAIKKWEQHKAARGDGHWHHDKILQAQDLDDAVRGWDLTCEYDKDGNLAGIEREYSNWTDEADLFDQIAPFIQPGGWLEFLGEDGDRWRFVFTGKTRKRIEPELVWEPVEMDQPVPCTCKLGFSLCPTAEYLWGRSTLAHLAGDYEEAAKWRKLYDEHIAAAKK